MHGKGLAITFSAFPLLSPFIAFCFISFLYKVINRNSDIYRFVYFICFSSHSNFVYYMYIYITYIKCILPKYVFYWIAVFCLSLIWVVEKRMFSRVIDGWFPTCSSLPVADTAENPAYDAPCWHLSFRSSFAPYITGYLWRISKVQLKYNLQHIKSKSRTGSHTVTSKQSLLIQLGFNSISQHVLWQLLDIFWLWWEFHRHL